MKCQDCVHYEVCYLIEHYGADIDDCVDCDHFKPKSRFVELKQGEWIEDGYSDEPCVCSVCGEEAPYTSIFGETFDYDWEENLQPTGYEEIKEYDRTPYCPNCGAKMALKEREKE